MEIILKELPEKVQISEQWLFNAIMSYSNSHFRDSKQLVAKKFALMDESNKERLDAVNRLIKESDEKISKFEKRISREEREIRERILALKKEIGGEE